MKILFLDIDGVCNSEATFTKDPNAYFPIDKYMAFLIGKIQLETDCQVVLSSSWRHHKESVDEIEKRIVKTLDITPHDSSGFRGKEVDAWLARHPEVYKYAILDDDSDFYPEQLPSFFKTDWKVGLTDEIALKVIEHLNS